MATETFAIDTPGAIQATAGVAGQAQPVRAQAASASVGFSGGADLDTRANDATSQAILKLGSDLLQPKIKEAAERQFLQGVQEVQDGAALKDVVQNRPWWTEIFGPSAAVQGARAYTVQKQVSDFAGRIATQMPKLAQEGPEALTAASAEIMKSLRTGDAYADTKIMGSITEQMAPLYKQHAKEHYVYQQNKAVRSQQDSWDADAKTLQAQLAANKADPTKVTDQDVAGIKAGFLSRFTPFGDQSDDSYEKSVYQFVANAGSQGNFQAIQLLRENGVLQALGPDYQMALDSKLRTGATLALNKVNSQYPELGNEASVLLSDMSGDPAKIIGKLKGFNEKVAAVTGVPQEYGSYFNPAAFDNQVSRVLNHQASKNEQAEHAAQIAAGKNAQFGRAVDAAASGTPGSLGLLKSLKLVNDEDVERAIAAGFDLSDPVKAARAADSAGTEKSSFIQQRMAQALGSEEYTDGGALAAQTFKLMGATARGAQVDEKTAAFLDRYQSLVDAKVPAKAAWASAKTQAAAVSDALPETAKAGVQSKLKQLVVDENQSIFQINNISDQSMRVLQGLTNGMVKRSIQDGGIPSSEAAARAYARVRASDKIEFMGEHVLLNQGTKDRVSASQFYTFGADNISTKEAGELFNEVAEERAKAVGASLDTALLVRSPDVNGTPQYLVVAYDDKGGAHGFNINGAELKARSKTNRTQRAADTAAAEAAQRAQAPREQGTSLVNVENPAGPLPAFFRKPSQP